MSDLEKRVHSNLDDALENGYDVSGWEIEEILVDLFCFAADLEDEDIHDLRPHIESWVAARRNIQ